MEVKSMRLFLVVAGLVALITGPLIFYGDQIDEKLAGDRGVALLREYGSWAWMVGIGLIVSDLMLPVPAPAVMAALGIMYGPLVGGLVGSFGSFLAGMTAYCGCRLMGLRAARMLVGEENLGRLSRFFDRVGLWAVVLSRWMPLLPELLACLAGLSRMHLGRFSAALACGSLAMGMAFATLGTAYADRPVVGLLLSAILPLAAWPFVRRFLKRQELDEVQAAALDTSDLAA
jgi:uncharacterized membrane protein YdjX (TVP38/TMEM64 family)